MDLPSTETVEGTPSYPVNCSNFTSIQFWYLDLARGVSGAVSLLVCSLILFLILLHKAYASLLQRFLLYLTLVTWLTEATYTMHLVKYADHSGQGQFCVTLALLEILSSSMFILIALEITLLLTYQVYGSLQRQLLESNLLSKCSKVSLEVSAVSLSVLSSPVLALVPGTIALNSECNGGRLFIIGAIPYALLVIVIGIFVVFVIILFCISACQSPDSRRLNCKMIRDNLVLLAFYLVFSSVNISSQLLLSAYDKYSLRLVYAVGFPFNKLVLLLGFLFYVYSFKNLTLGTFQTIKKMFLKCCQLCSKHIYHIEDNSSTHVQRSRYVTGGPTYKSSHPQVYPSETVFSPPYTGAFTSIMRRDSSDEGERKHLITSNIEYNNIQYESI